MEINKITNLLNDLNNEELKLATKKWYATDSQTAKNKYNENNSIKFETKSIKSSLCDYSDAFILVSGETTVRGHNDTHVAFKRCTIFYR